MFVSLFARRDRASLAAAVRCLSVICCSLLLMSCGGGGGGGGGGNDGFRVTLTRNSLSWTYYEGAEVTPQEVTGVANGTYNGTLYISAVVENTGGSNAINPAIPIVVAGTVATATVRPAANLPAGTYAGRILFLACSDAACINRIGGTPLPVDFTVTVQQAVRATPSSITPTVVSGDTYSVAVSVTPGFNENAFTVGNVASFMQIADQTAAGFRVTFRSLPVATYQADIPLFGSNGSHFTIPITYAVTAPPGGQRTLSVSPTSMTFVSSEGAASGPQTLQVTESSWRPGLQPAAIQYQQGQDWLQMTAASGGYQVVANAANLSAGSYSAVVTLRNNPLPQWFSEPQPSSAQVYVALTVGAGLVRPADVVRLLDSESTSASLAGSVNINVADGPVVSWNATSSVPWLTVTSSGVTGSALNFTVDPVWLVTAQNFAEHVANITVTVPGSVITPMSFPIRISRRLAEVSGVGARVQVAGRPTTLLVSGRGFSTVSNPAGRVAVTGNAPVSVQRVSDTKLTLQFSSLNVGTHMISVSNALNIATQTRDSVAITPAAHSYATVATGGGRISALTMDHERDTLYAVRRGATAADGRLLRFRSGGSGWTVDSPALTAVDNVGVLNDGNVIVNTLPGGLSILDADTMNETFSLDLTCTGFHGSSASIPVTIDGRAWLSVSNNVNCTGAPLWANLGWFDSAARTFQLFPIVSSPLLRPPFPSGPDFVMSRDGERLVLHTQENAPYAPLAYMDVTESVLRPLSPGTWRWMISAVSSDDGHRLMYDNNRVVDETFDTVGRIFIPDYTSPASLPYPLAGVLSPDGSRAYVLTYRYSDIGQPSSVNPPRVYVFDISGDVGDTGVPVLGYFEIADYPGCLDASACESMIHAQISLDGSTLFFVGNQRLVVVPVATTLSTAY